MSSNAAPDKAALFERTMVPHLDSAYNLARWLTRTPEDADEVVQEAYLRAFRYFDSFTGADGRGWLLAIVRNCCLNLFRQKKGDAAPFDERIHTGPSVELTPESSTQTNAALRSLRACIEGLPVEFRESLILRELEDFSYKQIADLTALPIGTVMSRLARARKRLRECMASKGESV